MFDLFSSGKRIINVDESWIDSTSFCRKHYQPVSGLSSFNEKPVSPRISMIAAVGSCGSVFLSLTQVNTNSEVLAVYFTELVKQLEKQNKNFRNDTIILLDNAAYHGTTEVREFLAFLGVPVIYSGPYSYTAAPAERYFAHFKAGQLNLNALPTGKR